MGNKIELTAECIELMLSIWEYSKGLPSVTGTRITLKVLVNSYNSVDTAEIWKEAYINNLKSNRPDNKYSETIVMRCVRIFTLLLEDENLEKVYGAEADRKVFIEKFSEKIKKIISEFSSCGLSIAEDVSPILNDKKAAYNFINSKLNGNNYDPTQICGDYFVVRNSYSDEGSINISILTIEQENEMLTYTNHRVGEKLRIHYKSRGFVFKNTPNTAVLSGVAVDKDCQYSESLLEHIYLKFPRSHGRYYSGLYSGCYHEESSGISTYFPWTSRVLMIKFSGIEELEENDLKKCYSITKNQFLEEYEAALLSLSANPKSNFFRVFVRSLMDSGFGDDSQRVIRFISNDLDDSKFGGLVAK